MSGVRLTSRAMSGGRTEGIAGGAPLNPTAPSTPPVGELKLPAVSEVPPQEGLRGAVGMRWANASCIIRGIPHHAAVQAEWMRLFISSSVRP